jgi:vacuolar-type H+-ATPase subunit I/STV1
MERLQGTESTPLQRHEDRVRKLTDMLDDPDLSRREKLAVHRTLNETEGKLRALRALEKKVEEPGQSEEARIRRRALIFQALKESGEKRQRELKEEMRAEVYAELRAKGVEIEV